MVNQEHFHKIRALIETVKHHNVSTPPCLSATVMFLLWNAVCFTPDITKLKVPLLTHLPSIARFSDIIRSSRHFFPDQIHICSAIQRLFEVLWEKSSEHPENFKLLWHEVLWVFRLTPEMVWLREIPQNVYYCSQIGDSEVLVPEQIRLCILSRFKQWFLQEVLCPQRNLPAECLSWKQDWPDVFS